LNDDFLTLACPSCGGNLSVTSDQTRFACPYCKRQHLIRRNDGHVQVTPIIESLERMSAGVDRNASELAIQRLKKDRRVLKDRIKDQEDAVKYRKRARTDARDELKGTKMRSVIGLVMAGVIGLPSVGLFLVAMATESGGPAWFGVLLAPVSAVAGLVGVLARMKISPLVGRVDSIQKKLNKEYARLDELNAELDRIDAELEHHTRIVSL
jgi:predicted RNA-binding Zn-ribbon protein involved in translation (DUF1610 family)